MIIETQLQFKETEIKPYRCQVDEVVELTHGNFEYLRNCPLDDYDFIKTALDKLPVTNDNTSHCILALDESGSDGILIDPQGYHYARYTAYIPNARLMLEAEEYPSLTDFAKSMREIAETVNQVALNSHTDGEYVSDLEYIETEFQPNVLDKYLLVDMLNERPEFKNVEYDSGALVMSLNDEYTAVRRLATEEIQEICARHKLMRLNAKGGEWACFGGKIVQDFDFVGMDLSDADCIETRFIRCSFVGCELDGLSAPNAIFENCKFDKTSVSSVNFSGAKIIDSSCVDATFWNCDMTDTAFQNCDLSEAEFINCILKNTDLEGSNTYMTKIRDCTEEPEGVDQEEIGSGISM